MPRRRGLPDVGHDDHGHRVAVLTEPDDVAARQPQRGEDVGDQAHVGLEHRLPGDGADHGDDRVRQQNHGAQDGAALEREVEQQRHGRAEDEFQADGEACEEERLAERRPPLLACQGVDVVFQSDEAGQAGGADAVLVQREPDRVADGDRRHQGHDHQRRGGHAECELALGPVAAACLRLGRGLAGLF